MAFGKDTYRFRISMYIAEIIHSQLSEAIAHGHWSSHTRTAPRGACLTASENAARVRRKTIDGKRSTPLRCPSSSPPPRPAASSGQAPEQRAGDDGSGREIPTGRAGRVHRAERAWSGQSPPGRKQRGYTGRGRLRRERLLITTGAGLLITMGGRLLITTGAGDC